MYVTDLNGNTEPLNHVQRVEITEEVNGSFTLSLTSFFHANNPGHELLEEESVIHAAGYDFRIKQLKESKGRKEATSISTFFDLVGKRKDEIYGGTRTFDEFATFVFSDTGWTFTSEVSGSILIPNFGNDNVVKLAQGLCAAYKCEFKIFPDNHVHFVEEIGPDNDAQYRYGHNIKALSRSVDTTNLRTQITGYGAEGLVVTYTSPNADKFGIIKADPVHDDRFTIGENLAEYIQRQLTDYPEVSIELDTIELTNKELGERVWLIYEPMGIEFQTRILAKKSTIQNGELRTTSVVLGNATPKTLSDILTSQRVEIDENAKQTRSRFEQTNERITLEVERVDESIATLDVKADAIALTVKDLKEDTEAEFIVMAGNISSKVSKTDYNGETVMSLIEQTPYYITLSAQKINFDGEVFGNSNARFEGQVWAERIVGNEISGVTVRTSNATRYVHMRDQEITLFDSGLDKMRIGFRNEYGTLTQTPYIIMGYGQNGGRDKMVIEKESGYFNMVYSTQTGESSIKMNYSGSLSVRSDRVLYLEANSHISANATIHAPDFNTTSTVRAKNTIHEYEGNASEIVNSIGVYQYYLNQDLQNGIYDNPQIGFIAEGAPELKAGDAVSLYRAIALSWKALQEKDVVLKELQQKVDDIELMIGVM